MTSRLTLILPLLAVILSLLLSPSAIHGNLLHYADLSSPIHSGDDAAPTDCHTRNVAAPVSEETTHSEDHRCCSASCSMIATLTSSPPVAPYSNSAVADQMETTALESAEPSNLNKPPIL